MSQADLNLQLMLTLNDQVSAGMRRMMRDMQSETDKTINKVQMLDRIWNKANSNPNQGLLNSMRQLGREAKSVLDVVSKIGAGVAAGAYAVGRMAAAPMAYDQRLAVMANTAFSDVKTVEGRKAGVAQLNAMILKGARAGKVSRDDAASAAEVLVSENVDLKTVEGILPQLMQMRNATNSDPAELARMAANYQRSLNLDSAGIIRMMNNSIAAGAAGSFETRNMAAWMPKILAGGKTAGYVGESGARKLLAYSQAAATTAGSPDEAGNNMVNLLAKVNSEDTKNDAKKLGIDLRGTLLKASERGIDSISATNQLIDDVASKDPQYVALKKKLAAQTDPGERKNTLESMNMILEGGAIGKLYQDQQARLALLGIRFNPQVVARSEDKMANSGNEIALGFGVTGDTFSSNAQALETEKDASKQRLFDAAAPNALFEAMTATAQKFPLLTDSVVGATTAIIAMTAAAAGFAGMGGLLGLGGKGGALAAGKGLLGGAGKLALGGALLGGTAAAVAGAGYAGWEAGTWFNDKFIKGTKAEDKIGEAVARMLAFFGNEDAKRAIVINNQVQIDGKTVAESTNQHNAAEARRK